VTWLRRLSTSKFLWMLVVLVALALAIEKWVAVEGGPRAVVQRWGIWAPLVSLVIQTITTMTPVGSMLISVLNGALFPFWTAFALNLASGTLGGIGMYYLWRRGDHEFDIQTSMRALPAWFREHAGDNVPFLVALRLVPWAGGALADMIAGSHHVPLRTQVLSLVIGYIPGSLLYALMGAGFLRL
jgi:uncharacterized membrane protein YdjX (TVP38/TMEM64 family)